MVNSNDIRWFKTNFAEPIAAAVQGTPFDIDMLTAIACQETGSLWGPMRHNPALSVPQIVALCCGDTLDADKGRVAFPRTKADLLAVPKGPQMFEIGRKALLDMAAHVPGYGFAQGNPRKFCHGYGIFQYDLQFFLTDPDYFLQRRYERFETALARALVELKTGLRKRGLQDHRTLTDAQFCEVAICYNTGQFNPAKGLRQGHADGGKYYGEFIRDFLAMAHQVTAAGPAVGVTVLPAGPVASSTGPAFRVETAISNLRLRSAPKKSQPDGANVLAEMPDDTLVRAITGTVVNGFIEVEVTLGGKLFRGFAAARYLVRLGAADDRPTPETPDPETPGPETAAPRLPAAHLTPAPGAVTRRTAPANAHALNEADMPRRSASDPQGLRADLGRIIAYLGTDIPAHKRYQPRDGLTFCNIYAHDYCALAGAYLPRVWWTQPALLKIAAGQGLAAKIGNTVDELRANDLFRWLRDFGTSFGWTRAVTAGELQDHANMGGVALIVARRKQDGRSGHIVAVVPETAEETARRDSTGAVTAPLQSQAGTVNFRYGLSRPGWWLDDRFAESAFWMHP